MRESILEEHHRLPKDIIFGQHGEAARARRGRHVGKGKRQLSSGLEWMNGVLCKHGGEGGGWATPWRKGCESSGFSGDLFFFSATLYSAM